MILDAGKHDGVKPGEAVVDPRGMIGRIFLAGEHTSWVILLTDLNSRIPVTIEPGNIQAIMAGDNTPTPVLETLAQQRAAQGRRSGHHVGRWRAAAAGPAGGRAGRATATISASRCSPIPSTSDDVRILDFKTAAGTAARAIAERSSRRRRRIEAARARADRRRRSAAARAAAVPTADRAPPPQQRAPQPRRTAPCRNRPRAGTATPTRRTGDQWRDGTLRLSSSASAFVATITPFSVRPSRDRACQHAGVASGRLRAAAACSR